MFGNMLLSASEVVVFATNSTNQSAQNYFTAADWASGKRKRLIIPSGVTLGATSSGTPALRTGTGFGGILQVENSGAILGAGGVPNSGVGGTAFYADTTVRLINYGLIYAGGGAGGQGGTGGQGYYYDYQREPPSGYQGWSVFGYNAEQHQDTSIVNTRIFWAGSNLGDFATNATSIDVGAYTYFVGPIASSYSSGSGNIDGHQIARQLISPASTIVTSGGNGGNGGRGQGYDGSNAGGNSGAGGGINAGTGGTGGTGASYGNTGNTGNTGSTGNYSGGLGGSSGGLAGFAIANSGFVNLSNTGTLLGR